MNFFRRRSEQPKPNIVLLLLDQFRNDARGFHPVFDELKRRGCVFSETITYAPYTLASMHATMTGLYGRQSGVDAYTKSDQYDNTRCYSLPQYLRNAGYHTRGYTFSPILVPPDGFESLRIVPEAEEPGILDSHRAELGAAFAQPRPFFSFLHYGEIHHVIVREVLRKYSPFDEEYFGHRDRNLARYREHAYQAGEYTARILERLEALDTAKNTLLIVMADHGGGVGEKPGEKAYGVFTYDYSIKTWMYLVHPTLVPQGVEYDVQVRTVDLLPTIVDMLGIPLSKKHIQPVGRSLLPIVRGEESADRIAFTETGGVEGPHPSPDAPNVKSIRCDGWKLIYNTTTNGFELYDLRRDPDERQNVYAQHSDKARELWLAMSDYL